MKIVLLYSGGLDSTTLLYHLRDLGHEVVPLFIHYGQRHEKKEREAAVDITCSQLRTVKASMPWCNCVSSLTGGYGELTGEDTVVPGRNLVFLSLAASLALSIGAEAVAYGPNAGDAKIYEDCRPAFVSAIADVLGYHNLIVMAPFILHSKRYIVAEARRIGVPIERTWSCYAGGEKPCGECGACIERQKALSRFNIRTGQRVTSGIRGSIQPVSIK